MMVYCPISNLSSRFSKPMFRCIPIPSKLIRTLTPELHRTFEFPNEVEFSYLFRFAPQAPSDRLDPRNRTPLNFRVRRSRLSASFPVLTLHVVLSQIGQISSQFGPLGFFPPPDVVPAFFKAMLFVQQVRLLHQPFLRLFCLSNLFDIVPVFFKTLLFVQFVRCCSSLF